MKFGRLLREATANMPEMDRLSQAYKQLKKRIKKLERCNMEVESIASAQEGSPSPTCSRDTDSASDCAEPNRTMPASGRGNTAHVQAEGCLDDHHSVAHGSPEPTSAQAQEHKFSQALAETLGDFNTWFLEREEESVLHLEQLIEESAEAMTEPGISEQLLGLETFHSEALRLLHWSVVAYNSIVKILKKHCKHTGGLLRNQSMDSIVDQPFCCTTEISGLVRRAEAIIKDLKARRDLIRGEALPSVGSGLGLALGPSGKDGQHPQSHHALPSVADGHAAQGELLSLNSFAARLAEDGCHDANLPADGLRQVSLSLALKSTPTPPVPEDGALLWSISDGVKRKTEGEGDTPPAKRR